MSCKFPGDFLTVRLLACNVFFLQWITILARNCSHSNSSGVKWATVSSKLIYLPKTFRLIFTVWGVVAWKYTWLGSNPALPTWRPRILLFVIWRFISTKFIVTALYTTCHLLFRLLSQREDYSIVIWVVGTTPALIQCYMATRTLPRSFLKHFYTKFTPCQESGYSTFPVV